MPKPNLSRMDVESLMDLRDQVDQRLHEHRVELQKQLERMDKAIAPAWRRESSTRATGRKRVEREKSCAQISWSFR